MMENIDFQPEDAKINIFLKTFDTFSLHVIHLHICM